MYAGLVLVWGKSTTSHHESWLTLTHRSVPSKIQRCFLFLVFFGSQMQRPRIHRCILETGRRQSKTAEPTWVWGPNKKRNSRFEKLPSFPRKTYKNLHFVAPFSQHQQGDFPLLFCAGFLAMEGGTNRAKEGQFNSSKTRDHPHPDAGNEEHMYP